MPLMAIESFLCGRRAQKYRQKKKVFYEPRARSLSEVELSKCLFNSFPHPSCFCHWFSSTALYVSFRILWAFYSVARSKRIRIIKKHPERYQQRINLFRLLYLLNCLLFLKMHIKDIRYKMSINLKFSVGLSRTILSDLIFKVR